MRPSLIPALGLAALGAVLAVAQPSKAECLYPTSVNTCPTFRPFNPLPNTATVEINDPSRLPGTRYVQIGFSRDPAGTPGFAIANISYSLDGTTFTPIATPSITGEGPDEFEAIYSPRINLGSALAQPSIWFRYDLPASGPANTNQIGVFVRTNNNGAFRTAPPTTDPAGTQLLSLTATNPVNGDLYTFAHTYQVPGPVPLLGAAAAFSASRRLRRRIKAAA